MKIVTKMPFSPVPSESKSQINKAGKILSKGDFSTIGFDDAVELTRKWRACHAYPINTFQSTLRTKLKSHDYSDFVVAQRLKRLPTIIDKLKRYPNMQLTTMQDIGGVRAILSSIEDVYSLSQEYSETNRFAHVLVDERDYIECPRDEDGYRSLHMIFRYKNKLNPAYDELKLEMQIRTVLQHAWATAVETMGTLLGQALKSRQGDEKWLEFFALTSSAFAYKEGCKPVPRFAHFTERETYAEVAKMESELGALEKMKGFSIAINAIHTQKGKGFSYHLIILDSINKEVQVRSFDRDSFEKAMNEYSEIEIQVTQGKKVEPVLVSSGPIETLKRAYPNFFLDTSGFRTVLTEILLDAARQ